MSNPGSSKIAKALAMAQSMGGQAGEPGLQDPPEQQILERLGMVANGYGAGNLGGSLAGALAQKAGPALEGLGEAGAIFPEGTPPSELPEIAPGSKTGDPHALFAYQDDFGPGMTKRDIYNVFGDPTSEAVKKVGFGSSVPADVLKKLGIPIIGKQAKQAFH